MKPIQTTFAYGLLSSSIGISILLFTLLIFSQPLFASEFDFLTEHPGKLSATVTGSHNLLGKVDAAAFKRNLERLRNLMAGQPVFNPTRGVEVIGCLRPNDSQPKTNKVPIPGFGYLRLHFYFLDKKSGKPVRICCTTDEIFVSVNHPDASFDAYQTSEFPSKTFY